jgi:hypothetical protein
MSHEPEQADFPAPIPSQAVELSPDLLALTELLAEHAHVVWARGRLAEGWRFGVMRNDAQKTHPCLIPYCDLPESEKAYDRRAAMETVRAIVWLGYTIRRDTDAEAERQRSGPVSPL